MKANWKIMAIGFGLVLAAQAASADVIEMKNGDRITGTIVSKAGNKLTINTSYGELVLKWDEVAKLSTEAATELMLDDKTMLTGNISTDQPGSLKIHSDVIPESAPIDLARISYINPPPEVSGKGLKINARVNAGAGIYKGNTDTQNIHLDGEVVVRSLSNRYTAGAIYNWSEDSGEKTADNTTAYIKYDHFFTEKLYGYLNGGLYKDKFKDLNLRTTIGPGLGYQLFETDRTNLALEAGATYVNEDFITEPDDDYAAGRWAVKFDHYLVPDRLQLFHNHEFLLGFKDIKDMILRTQTGLRVPLFSGINAGFQFNYDWDRSPAAGTKKADYGYLFTLGYSL